MTLSFYTLTQIHLTAGGAVASNAPLYLTTENNTPYMETYARYTQMSITSASFTASLMTSHDKPYIVIGSKLNFKFILF